MCTYKYIKCTHTKSDMLDPRCSGAAVECPELALPTLLYANATEYGLVYMGEEIKEASLPCSEPVHSTKQRGGCGVLQFLKPVEMDSCISYHSTHTTTTHSDCDDGFSNVSSSTNC
jgi:hypothetical protein